MMWNGCFVRGGASAADLQSGHSKEELVPPPMAGADARQRYLNESTVCREMKARCVTHPRGAAPRVFMKQSGTSEEKRNVA